MIMLFHLRSADGEYSFSISLYFDLFALCMCMGSVAQLCLILCGSTDWLFAAPLSMMFPRQECWNGVSFPTPGDLPNPGMKHVSFTSHLHWQEDSLPLAPPGKTHLERNYWKFIEFRQYSGFCCIVSFTLSCWGIERRLLRFQLYICVCSQDPIQNWAYGFSV